MRVAIYARVSADCQDPENQLRNCCDSFGYMAISYEEPAG
jgi:DNA invertase Pin-like site-specific DNA recombinase